MKLWYLRPKGAGWAPFTTGAVAVVVRAENETDARGFMATLRMPAVTARDARWIDVNLTSCIELQVDRKPLLTELTTRPDSRE